MSPNLPNVSWRENSPLVENCFSTFSNSTPRYLWQKTHTFVLGSMHINQSSIVIKQKNSYNSRKHVSITWCISTMKYYIILIFSSVQFSCSVMSDSLWPYESQHARPPCPSPTLGVHSDSHPSSLCCHPAISSSVVPFSSCPQSLPASESFPMSQLFTWGGQSTEVSALVSFLPKKSQGWSPSEWIGWISLQSKGLSRVFSNITVQKHHFFGAQPSSQVHFN